MKLADKRRNNRWWFVGYECGAWRIMPAWYDTEATATYCEAPGHPLSPDHYGVTAGAVLRPPFGYPRHGTGKPPDYPPA